MTTAAAAATFSPFLSFLEPVLFSPSPFFSSARRRVQKHILQYLLAVFLVLPQRLWDGRSDSAAVVIATLLLRLYLSPLPSSSPSSMLLS